jgi:hypothetical protein
MSASRFGWFLAFAFTLVGCDGTTNNELDGGLMCRYPAREAWVLRYAGASRFNVTRRPELDNVCRGPSTL